MTGGFLSHLASAAVYIERHIKAGLSLDRISSDLYLSKFYLDRAFKAITGQTLMRYIAGRKLAMSLNELLNTSLRVIDIAHEYGFQFEQSYIRAFKREYGITPDGFRKTRCELKVTPAINTDDIKATADNAVLIKPVMTVKPSFFAVGSRCHVDEAAYIDTSYLTDFANDFYDNKRLLIENVINDRVYYGHVLYDWPYVYYTSCVETPEDEPVPEGLTKIHIPENQYWAFKYIGLHNPRKTTFRDFLHIYQAAEQWLPRQAPRAYHFEKIDSDACDENYCELDLYYPI